MSEIYYVLLNGTIINCFPYMIALIQYTSNAIVLRLNMGSHCWMYVDVFVHCRAACCFTCLVWEIRLANRHVLSYLASVL